MVWGVIGAGTIILSVAPVARWVGAPDTGPVWEPHLGAWGIGSLVVAVMGVLVGRVATAPAWSRGRWRVAWPDPRWMIPALALATTAAAAGTMAWVFDYSPHLVDEIAQLFQANVFASGRLAAPAPSHPEFFLLPQTIITDAGWVAQYPPLHAALLSLGFRAGLEWLVNPLLAGVAAVLVYRLANGLYGPKTGTLAALLWFGSSWVMFMSASFMNHVSTVTLLLVTWSIVAQRTAGWRAWTVAGMTLAAAAAIRPLDAVAGTLPVMAALGLRRSWRPVPWMVLGAVPVGLMAGVVNGQLFGHPLTTGYAIAYGAEHGLGFHVDPYGVAYTPLVALSNAAVAIRRLQIYLFDWPIPALLPLAIWALAARHHRRADLVVAAGVIAIPLAYALYWHSGFFRGPRFYYASVPFLVIGTARAWRWVWTLAGRLPSRWFRPRAALAAAAVVTVGWGAADVLPSRVRVYRNEQVTLRMQPRRALEEAGVSRALVLVPESWASRTIARLWAAGARPGLVERAFRQVDTCDLYHVLGPGSTPAGARVRIDSLIRQTVNPPPRADVPDPWVRLRPRETLPGDCARELQRDFDGFTVYSHLGWRNAVDLSTGIVFARDLFEHNDALASAYADWDVWRWAPPPGRPGDAPRLHRLPKAVGPASRSLP